MPPSASVSKDVIGATEMLFFALALAISLVWNAL